MTSVAFSKFSEKKTGPRRGHRYYNLSASAPDFFKRTLLEVYVQVKRSGSFLQFG